MQKLLEDAGLKAEVITVDLVHYLRCLDTEEAAVRYKAFPPFDGDINTMDVQDLPPMVCIDGTYFEKENFPFLICCGQL